MLKRTALAAFVIAALAVAMFAGMGATTASFSDKVTSNANSFKAGTLYLNALNPSGLCPSRQYGGVTGNTGVDGNTGCSITGGATWSNNTAMIPSGVSPSGVASATYSIKNIGSLDGRLSVGSMSYTVDAGHSSCTVSNSNFVLGTSYSATTLAASGTASVGITGTAPTTSANACQGATFTASIPFLMNNAATTGFSDILTSTGNTFVMATLPAPVLSAGLNTDTTKVNLSWTNTDPSGTTFTINRYSGGSCAGTATAIPGNQTSPYTDSPGAAGQYSYIVTAHYNNWTVASNCATATTSVPTKALYINNSGGTTTGAGGTPANLQSTTGSGTTDVSPAANAPGPAFLWPSANQVTVSSNNSWTLSLYVTGPSQLSSSAPAAVINVTVWLSTSASCPAATAGQTIGTATSDISLPSGGVPFTAPLITITPTAGFTPGTGYVCLQLVNNAQNNGTAHHLYITGNVNSYLSGPWS